LTDCRIFTQFAVMRFKLLLVPILFALAQANFCHARQIVVAPDKPNGVYQIGDTVHWRLQWTGQTDAPPAHFEFLQGGLTDAGQGEISFSNGVAGLETEFNAPGAILAEVKWRSADGKDQRALAGAVAAPDRIPLSAPCPADFDVFWQSELKELKAVPANPRLESVDIGNTNLEYWKITLDNIRRTHIQGQMARPAHGKKFPALLIVQWAGVYPLQRGWVTGRAEEGWLALNIQAHDLPIDAPESFYKDQFAGPLHNYWSIGNDDRDTSYYLRMYLSCFRAAEYLLQRKDWDGKTLVVTGTSQGGMQTLMLAGLHPRKLTAALALVPAGCDMLGPDVGRAPGWPQWCNNIGPGKDPKKVRQASRYYDIANFAALIKCPVLVGLGLQDETCPPAGVFAAFNQISSPKEVVILPKSSHQDDHGTQSAYNQRMEVWLSALRRGQPAPVAR
jgi:cephalosporin-C deacetylase-like acetyl esterase